MNDKLPSGRVTFAFTDVVSSTQTFATHGERYVEALIEVRERIARHTTRVGGAVVETEGDGTFLAFPSADAAVKALSALMRDLDDRPSRPVPLRLRAGAHTGDAVPVGDGYVALAVHVAARVAGAAGPGQALVSGATYADLARSSAEELGTYALKDVAEPVSLWRVHGDTRPPRATPARRTNIRVPRTSFDGRGRELDDLDQMLRRDRLVTIVGTGGVGKSRLVSQWGLEQLEATGRSVWIVELATLTALDPVVPAIAQACGTTAATPGELVGELAGRDPFVLVLDNCEHVLDAVVPVVEELMARCPEVHLVCTSREPLLVPGETVLRLGVLSDREAAVALFTHRATAAGAAPGALARAVVEEVCETLDFLPLAIELAALWATDVPPAHLADRLRSEMAEMARRGGESRQRNLDVVLDWSVRALAQEELDGLLSLSVWPGRFSPAMAESLLSHAAPVSAAVVPALVRRSLVDLDGDDYRLLFSIRETARKRLAERVDLERRARDGLVQWAVSFASDSYGTDANYHDIPMDQALAVELALVLERDSPTDGIHMVWDLARHIARSRHSSPTLRELSSSVLAEGPPRERRSALVQGVALNILSAFARPVGLPREHLDAILAVVRGSGSAGVPLLQTLAAVAWELEITDRADEARSLRDEYIAIVESDADLAWLRPTASFGLGNNLRATARWGEAAAAYRTGLEIGAAQGNLASMNILHASLADTLLEMDRPREALEHSWKAVQLLPRPGSGRNFALRMVTTALWRLGEREASLAVGRDLSARLEGLALKDPHYRSELSRLLRDVPALADPPGRSVPD